MRPHKTSYESFIEMQVTELLGLFLPLPLYKHLLIPTASKPSCFCSSVPGPLNSVKFFGNPVEKTSFFTNVIGDCSLGFTCISYNGNVQISLNTDESTGIMPDKYLEEVDSYFTECVEKYL
jgi:hypothetical protein